MNPALKIWIIAPESTGDLNGMIGIAQKVSNLPPEIIPVNKVKWKPEEFVTAKLRNDPESKLDFPDIIISFGGSKDTNAAVVKLKEQLGGRPFLINYQRPNIHADKFDLIVQSDYQSKRVSGDNVISIPTVLHKVTPELLEKGRDEWKEELSWTAGRPVFSLLVGGVIGPIDNPRIDFTQKQARQIGHDVAKMVKEQNGVLIVTNSRRTPKKSMNALMDELEGINSYFYDWEKSKGNPYFGLLALSDHLIVTGDSMSMCCEATSTGKPVYIYDQMPLEDKHQKTIDYLYSIGHAKPLTGVFEKWDYKPLDLAEDVAQEVLRRINTPALPKQMKL